MSEEVMLHDDIVGSGDDILRIEAGRPYRLFLMPQKRGMEEKNNKAIIDALEKGKAKVYKKGDPGWFGPEDAYIMVPSLAMVYAYYTEKSGTIKAPEDKDLRMKADKVLGPASDRYGGIVLMLGLRMKDSSVIMTQGQDPMFDYQLMKISLSSIQAGMLKKAMGTVSTLERDIVITGKKQGKGVRWDSVTTANESYFFDDKVCSPAARELMYSISQRKRATLKQILAKTISDPELLAVINSKTAAGAAAGAADAAANTPSPPVEKGMASLIE